MNKFYVYVLKDVEGTVFYVGRGTNGRMMSHLAWSHNQGVNNRIGQASEKYEKILSEIVSWHSSKEEAASAEKELIKSFPPDALENITHTQKPKTYTKQGEKKRRKTSILHIRIYPDDKIAITNLAKSAGMSLSEFVVFSILVPDKI